MTVPLLLHKWKLLPAWLGVLAWIASPGCSGFHQKAPPIPILGSLANLPIEHVVIFAIDGLEQDTLTQYLAAPPRRPGGLHDLLGVASETDGMAMTRAVAVQQGATVFPSYTYPAWASLFTGVFPGSHGITGNSLFFRGRQVARYYTEYHLDAVKVQLENDFLSRDMAQEIPTLYEYIDHNGGESLVIHHMITRGSGKGTRKPDFDTLWNYQRNRSHAVDENTLWQAVAALKELNRDAPAGTPLRLPTLMTIYFSGLDHAEHVSPGNPETARLEYLKHLDDLIAKFIGGDGHIARHHFNTPDTDPVAIDSIDWGGLQRESVLERTLFVLVSDHGHTPINWHEALGIEDLKVMFNELSRNSERTYTLETPALIREESWTSKLKALFGFLHDGEIAPRADVVAVLNGGALGLYVKPEGGRWKDSPTYAGDISPIVQHVLLTLHKNAQAPEAVLYKEGTRYLYVPYRYDGERVHLLPTMDLEDSPLQGPEYPMAARRLNGLASRLSTGPQSAPDIILLADRKKKLTYNNKQDWRVIEPLDVEKHRHIHSDHGHLNASDSVVPIIFWHGGYQGGAPLRSICQASIVDVTPTILDVLGLLPFFETTLHTYLEEAKGASLKPQLERALTSPAMPAGGDQALCPATTRQARTH